MQAGARIQSCLRRPGFGGLAQSGRQPVQNRQRFAADVAKASASMFIPHKGQPSRIRMMCPEVFRRSDEVDLA